MKRLIPVLLVLLLTGCGVRLDVPDPTVEEPSAAEIVRQREALRAEVLSRIEFVEAGTLAANARVQLDALGGVWEAWPDGDGPDDAPERESADITAPQSTDEAASLLAHTTPDLVTAAVDAHDSAVASLYASIAVARTADETRLRVNGGEMPRPEWPETVITSSPELIRELDAAAYRLDILAAQDSANGRESSARADASLLRSWADASAHAISVVGSEDDPREPVYDAAGIDLGTLYGALTETMVAASATNSDRAAIIGAAEAAAIATVINGGEVAALPGVSLLEE